MNNQLKAAAIAMTVAAMVSSAQAYNGDLLAGFYQSGVGNTLVVDLGSYSSLYDGEAWYLGTPLTSAGFTLNSVGFNTSLTYGVVGYSGGTIYSTYNTGGNISTLNNNDLSGQAVNSIKVGINTLGINQGAQAIDATGKGADWSSETIVGGLNTSLVNTLSLNINATGVGGGNSFYALSSTGAFLNNVNNNGKDSPDNYFTVNGDGILTYGAPVVPEPSTLTLMAGFGGLALAFRRWFTRKATV